jgi:hypothetical protein
VQQASLLDKNSRSYVLAWGGAIWTIRDACRKTVNVQGRLNGLHISIMER